MLAIDIQEKEETVKKLVLKNGLSYTNLIDKTGETSAMYGVQSTPAKYLIGPGGNMVGAAMGYREWDSDEMKSLIELVMKPTN